MEIPENKKQFEITEKFIGWGYFCIFGNRRGSNENYIDLASMMTMKQILSNFQDYEFVEIEELYTKWSYIKKFTLETLIQKVTIENCLLR